jgi:hypothetical protein
MAEMEINSPSFGRRLFWVSDAEGFAIIGVWCEELREISG